MYIVVTVKCSVMSDSLRPHGYNPPGSFVHGIFQARILEWVVISFSRGSSRPRDRTHVSCISHIGGGFFTTAPPGTPLNVYSAVCQLYLNKTQKKMKKIQMKGEEWYFTVFPRRLFPVSPPLSIPLGQHWHLLGWLELDEVVSFATGSYWNPGCLTL